MLAGGDRINCDYDTSAPTCDLTTIKLHWNSVLLIPGAKYATSDIPDFYLGTPMPKPEYMRIPLNIRPDKIIQEYDLLSIVSDSWVYIKISKGIYSLPQAGKLATNLLKKRLATVGYYPCQSTTGLWRHKCRSISFTMVVYDFGVKFVGEHHANHLKKPLERWYDITTDWSGNKYVGISLQWDYKNRILDTSVPGFVKSKLHEYQHPKPEKPQHAPVKAAPINYGTKVQQAKPADESAPLSKEGIKRIQQVVGASAWYVRAADTTMAKTLSCITGRRQAKATKKKLEAKVK